VALACVTGGRRSTVEQDYRVTYEVVDTATDSASITCTNESGGTEQADASLPWTKSFTARYGDFLYISAQRKPIQIGDTTIGESGSITTRITVNGKTVKTTTSKGEYVIASASYRCCE